MQLEPGCRAPAAGPPGGTGRSNGVGRLSPAASMRAVVCGRYGPPDVLELQEVETPVPGPNEVLIRIRATTVSSADYRARTLDIPASLRLAPRLALGLFRPRQPILGSELAGDIEAVGRDVRRFKVGDAVFAFSDAAMGCHATRLALIKRLRVTGALSATALADGAPITRQAIVKHLQVLEDAGLVSHTKRGREVLYTVDPGRIDDARAFLDGISAGWDRAIERLRSLVEAGPSLPSDPRPEGRSRRPRGARRRR